MAETARTRRARRAARRDAPALPGLVLRIVAGPEEAAAEIAAEIAALARELQASGRGLVLGLAAGRSAAPVYHELAILHASGRLPSAALAGFLIDEYVGLARGDARRFAAWIGRELGEPLGLGPRLGVPDVDGTPFALALAARAHARAIDAAGGLDLLLLGVGRNGHVAFNEPGSARASRARVVALAPATRADAAPAFGGLAWTPRAGLTLGIAELRAARRVRLIACGAAKRDVLRRLRTETPGPALPASWLRGHADLVVYADRAALGD